MEGLDLVELLAGADELDRLAGDGLDRQGRAASGVAVELGEHHAVDVQPLVEGAGRVHRVLAGHGVHHQQDLVRLDLGLDGLQLVHEGLIHVQAAGCVEEDHVVAVLDGVLDALLGNLHGVDLAHLEDRDVQLAAHDLELFDGSGPVDVAGHEQRPLALLLFEQAGELGAVGGLAGALQADEHHDRRGAGRHLDALVVAAHELGELLVDDLDDHLGGVQAFEHVVADAALGHALDKFLDDLVADVRLQQRQADLAHGLLDVGLGQAALAAQTLEYVIQLVAQAFKCHVGLLL